MSARPAFASGPGASPCCAGVHSCTIASGQVVFAERLADVWQRAIYAASISLALVMIGLVVWMNSSRSFDAVADFSLGKSGVWSYGYYASNVRDRFVPFSEKSQNIDGDPSIEGYYAGKPGMWVPVVDHNKSGKSLSLFKGSIEYPATVLRMHPGPVQQPAIQGGLGEGLPERARSGDEVYEMIWHRIIGTSTSRN